MGTHLVWVEGEPHTSHSACFHALLTAVRLILHASRVACSHSKAQQLALLGSPSPIVLLVELGCNHSQ